MTKKENYRQISLMNIDCQCSVCAYGCPSEHPLPCQVNPFGKLCGPAKAELIMNRVTKQNGELWILILCSLSSRPYQSQCAALWVELLVFGGFVFWFLLSYINIISLMHLPRFSFLSHVVSHRMALLLLGIATKEGFSFDGTRVLLLKEEL